MILVILISAWSGRSMEDKNLLENVCFFMDFHLNSLKAQI